MTVNGSTQPQLISAGSTVTVGFEHRLTITNPTNQERGFHVTSTASVGTGGTSRESGFYVTVPANSTREVTSSNTLKPVAGDTASNTESAATVVTTVSPVEDPGLNIQSAGIILEMPIYLVPDPKAGARED